MEETRKKKEPVEIGELKTRSGKPHELQVAAPLPEASDTRFEDETARESR